MTLRDYQQDAVNAVMTWIRKSKSPCVVEAPTGAGKSHIIASICDELFKISGGKHVLVIAPSAELVVQDHEKYVHGVGRNASFFSASVGEKSVRHPVVFGTPKSVANSLELFGDNYCAVIVDEAHRITPTLRGIIDHMRGANPNLRIIGLTATPYRLGTGYIYASDETGKAYGEQHARNPYFTRRVYTIAARMLIERGFLTPPTCEVPEHAYDTSGLVINSMGKYTSESVDAAFNGKGRLTAEIVNQVVASSVGRRGVMFFAATIKHAHEIMRALPDGECRLVTGETPKTDRAEILRDFKSFQFKFIVNVDVLTTGFDAPHVDVVAILRATESVSLLQQIIGRGLRIAEDKSDCLVLDYAGNIERHCPNGDVFAPDVRTVRESAGGVIDVTCPDCRMTNLFAPNKSALESGQMDEFGYIVDLTGQRVGTPHGPMPGHYGRRCNGLVSAFGEHVRCSYRWTFKPCPECEAECDIAARYCPSCKHELVDPNDRLKKEFAKYKSEPKNVHCDTVTRWNMGPHVSARGNDCYRIVVTTPYRSFTSYLMESDPLALVIARHEKLHGRPRTVTYRKSGDFFKIMNINEPEDKL